MEKKSIKKYFFLLYLKNKYYFCSVNSEEKIEDITNK